MTDQAFDEWVSEYVEAVTWHEYPYMHFARVKGAIMSFDDDAQEAVIRAGEAEIDGLSIVQAFRILQLIEQS